MIPVPRTLDVIYCDDIRLELGNKISYMGVYTGELHVTKVPVLLPKLCLAVSATCDINDQFSTISISVVKLDATSETEILTTGIVPVEPLISPHYSVTRRSAIFHFLLAPFQIDANCRLQVRATTDLPDEVLTSGVLRIIVAGDETTSSIEQAAPDLHEKPSSK